MSYKGKKPITKIGIYLRKSRAEGGIRDLDKHKETLIELCEKNNWPYELYEEIESSQDINRSELQRLRRDIALGKIDAVMVYNIDRLTRKARHFYEIIEDYFLEQGVTRLFDRATEHDLTNTNTLTLLQLQATLSQAEYSFIVQRLNDGRKKSAKNGIWTGKQVYGFRFNKKEKKLEQVPEEAKVVREIADLLLIGDSYGGICDKINHYGYRTRKGNLFEVHNIKSIIHSPITRGHIEVKWKDETTLTENSHEGIINDSEYYKIKQILDDRAKNYKSLTSAPKHYLQSILKCPKCQKVMAVTASKKYTQSNGKRTYIEGTEVYYVKTCRSYTKEQALHKCGNNGCQAILVEDVVEKAIKSYETEIDKKIEELLLLNGEELVRSNKAEIEKLKSAIKKLETKEENFVDFATDGDIPKDIYRKKMAELKENKSKLRSQLIEAENKFSESDIQTELKQQKSIKKSITNWDKLSTEQKRQLVQLCFKVIYYEKFDKNKPFKLNCIPHERG